MNDARLESVWRFRRSAIAMFLIAACLIAWGALARNRDVLVAAVWPVLLGFAWALARYPDFHAELRDDALELTEPSGRIPWDSVIGVWSKRKCRAGDRSHGTASPLMVMHAGGVLEIPPWLNHPSADVYAWLIQRTAAARRSTPPERLKTHFDQAVAEFGDDRVYAYSRRVPLQFNYSNRAARFGCLATALTGVAWLIVGLVEDDAGAWIGWGIAAMLLGGFCRTAVSTRKSPFLPREVLKGPTELMLSPQGLALVQPDLSGKMRWDEIRDLKFHDGRLHQRIQIKIEGGDLFVDDVYDCPLSVIFERLEYHWR